MQMEEGCVRVRFLIISVIRLHDQRDYQSKWTREYKLGERNYKEKGVY